MDKNKVVLGYCKNFERIMNTDFLEGDNVSLQLVKIYKEFIFNIDINSEEDIENAREIDVVMGKYVEDYAFRKKLQEEMRTIKVKKGNNIIKTIVESIINIFKTYELELTRKIYISKWI